MKLRDVYQPPSLRLPGFRVNEVPGAHLELLYELLLQRTPNQSISHKVAPTWEDHVSFVMLCPYLYWYLIEISTGELVGAIYLTRQREIGIFVLDQYLGQGYGTKAVQILMDKHPGRFLANVNPNNEASAALWQSLGFNLLQLTYERAV